MRSILVKDFLEHRLTFIIVLAVAVVSIIGAAFFKVLDNDIARLLLFVIQGPLFVLLISNHIISSEVNNRTFRFLASLPMSRTSLWGVKLLFLMLFATALYFIYAILVLAAGSTSAEIFKLITSNPAKSLLFPILVLSFGYYSSMLPQGFGFIAGLLLLPYAAALYFNENIAYTINYSLGATLLIAMFLALSWICFMIDRKMNSPWRGLKGIALLIAAIIGFFVVWGTLNQLAERSQSKITETGFISNILDNGTKVYFGRIHKTPWWDVLQDHTSRERKHLRLFMHDIETGITQQVGPRSTMLVDGQNLGSEYLVVRKPIFTAGIMRKINRVVIDSKGNEVLILPENIIDADRKILLFSIDDQRFAFAAITKVEKNEFIEFYLFEKGKGLKVVHSVQKHGFDFAGFFKIPALDPAKEPLIIAAGSTDKPASLHLISLTDGKVKTLPEPYGHYVATVPGGLIFSRIKRPVDNNPNFHDHMRPSFDNTQRERELIKLDLDGNITQLDFIPSATVFIGTTHAGQVLVMTGAAQQPEYWKPEDNFIRLTSIAVVDFANKQLQLIETLDPDFAHAFKMHPSGQKGVLTSSNYDEEKKKSYTYNKVFDSDTLSFEDIPQLKDVAFVRPSWWSSLAEALPDNRFAFTISGRDVHILDLNDKTLELKANLRNLQLGRLSYDQD